MINSLEGAATPKTLALFSASSIVGFGIRFGVLEKWDGWEDWRITQKGIHHARHHDIQHGKHRDRGLSKKKMLELNASPQSKEHTYMVRHGRNRWCLLVHHQNNKNTICPMPLDAGRAGVKIM